MPGLQCWEADGHILRAVFGSTGRARVPTRPALVTAWLAGRQLAVLGLHDQGSAQHDRELVETPVLLRLGQWDGLRMWATPEPGLARADSPHQRRPSASLGVTAAAALVGSPISSGTPVRSRTGLAGWPPGAVPACRPADAWRAWPRGSDASRFARATKLSSCPWPGIEVELSRVIRYDDESIVHSTGIWAAGMQLLSRSPPRPGGHPPHRPGNAKPVTR